MDLYIYSFMPAGVAQSRHAFVGGTVNTWGSVADRLFSAATSIQGTSLSRSRKTLSNYLRLLFPEIVYSYWASK